MAVAIKNRQCYPPTKFNLELNLSLVAREEMKFYDQLISSHPIENEKNNLSKLITGKSFLGPKSPWTKVYL